eukprot:2072087-Rhodomonas_salina.1
MPVAESDRAPAAASITCYAFRVITCRRPEKGRLSGKNHDTNAVQLQNATAAVPFWVCATASGQQHKRRQRQK